MTVNFYMFCPHETHECEELFDYTNISLFVEFHKTLVLGRNFFIHISSQVSDLIVILGFNT